MRANQSAVHRPYTVPMHPDPAALAMPGQHVITASGQRAIVAMVIEGVVWAWVGRAPVPRPCIVRHDAFGGEHDQTLGLVA